MEEGIEKARDGGREIGRDKGREIGTDEGRGRYRKGER